MTAGVCFTLRFAFTKFRALLLLVVLAVAIVPAKAAVAQSDPRWGVLAEMAERDFCKGANLSSFRWEEPGKKLDVVWFVVDPRSASGPSGEHDTGTSLSIGDADDA